ncbi:MAG: sialate O-acetylesterase [Akkermansiaceae bacterium]|nr:sialate O-acetylesterase [Akkermansiaceae bacterium]
MNLIKKLNTSLCALALTSAPALHAQDLPDPDGKPADMSKPVQVFLIMGQSNTLEMGKVTDELKKAYPFLADDEGNWTTRQDVRNVSVMQKRGNMNVYRNEWLTVDGKNKIGIEIGTGYQLGEAIDAPVMMLKSSIGNRSLGWDLLPPGTPRYTAEGIECPGYGETYPDKKDRSAIVPYKEGETLGWYAGKQYDDDVGNAKKILENIGEYYPGATEYEVAGIIWWQGDKDMRNKAHAARYEENLGYLLKALRKDFNAPDAKFVCASLGQTDEGDTESGHGKILQAMKNFASSGEDIGFVYSKPLLDEPSASSGHYGGNAKTYMNVGLALGEKMVELVK